jgi:N-acetylneuraminic acid mutarotase
MSTVRSFFAAAVADDRVFAIGGHTQKVEAYTPSSNDWAAVADTSIEHTCFAAATASDGRIFAFGGDADPTVEAYTPSSNTWVKVASMPTHRSYHAAARGPDGRIFVIGGYDHDKNDDVATVEAYTP